MTDSPTDRYLPAPSEVDPRLIGGAGRAAEWGRKGVSYHLLISLLKAIHARSRTGKKRIRQQARLTALARIMTLACRGAYT